MVVDEDSVGRREVMFFGGVKSEGRQRSIAIHTGLTISRSSRTAEWFHCLLIRAPYIHNYSPICTAALPNAGTGYSREYTE